MNTAIQRFSLLEALKYPSLFVLLLWVIKSAEVLGSFKLTALGIAPQQPWGLLGILTAPLIHGSFHHLSANSASSLLLGAALFYGYPLSKWRVLLLIWILSGVGVWLFARPTVHYGASGLTHGIFFFLLVASILRRDRRSIGLMMAAFFMYGGMLMSIFPREEGISFEYHLFGGIAGVVAAIWFSHIDPKYVEQKYDWEDEPEEKEDEEDQYWLETNSPEQADEFEQKP